MSSKSARFWLFETAIPLGILGCAVAGFIAFGKVGPKKRPAIGGSPEARLRLLPAADIESCKSLDAANGTLDVRANGTVVPAREVQQAAEVGGRVIFKSPKCNAGEYVEEGELLIRIDPTDYQLEIERLNKTLIQEQELRRELEQELTNIAKLLSISEDELRLQDSELKRLQSLPQGFASETELDRSKAARFHVVNAKTQAENQQLLLQKRRARLDASEMLVQIQLKRAQVDLERSEIHAATSGMVVLDNAELDSFVQRGTIIVTLEEAGRMEVATDLRMDQLYWVLNQVDAPSLMQSRDPELVATTKTTGYELSKTPATILYHVSGRENEILKWEGHLERYHGVGLDPQTRMVPVRIVVEQPRRSRVDSHQGPSLSVARRILDL